MHKEMTESEKVYMICIAKYFRELRNNPGFSWKNYFLFGMCKCFLFGFVNMKKRYGRGLERPEEVY